MHYLSPSEVPFAFLDVETTGLDPANGDRVCEIAVLKTVNGTEVDRFVTLVNPGKSIPLSAISVHGITDVMVSRAPFFREIANELLSFLRGAVVVAHNARFDLGFLRMELSNIGLTLPQTDVVDTLGIARRYYSFASNGLGQIARDIGLPAAAAHRALADVLTTRSVFEYFLMDLNRRGIRLKRLKDVLKLHGESVVVEEDVSQLVVPWEVEEALRVRGKLRIKYLSAYGNETTIRVIEPLEISARRGGTYLYAYCYMRKERCTFRLDRILDMQMVTIAQSGR